MSVEAVSASPTALVSGSAVAAAPKKALDADAFMKLLVTQLTNQDPSAPMDTNQMISQTTQLAMMEQLTTLSRTGTEAFALDMRQTAAALLGRQAGYLDANGAPASGVVTAASFDGPVPQLTIGGTTVPLDALTSLRTATA